MKQRGSALTRKKQKIEAEDAKPLDQTATELAQIDEREIAPDQCSSKRNNFDESNGKDNDGLQCAQQMMNVADEVPIFDEFTDSAHINGKLPAQTQLPKKRAFQQVSGPRETKLAAPDAAITVNQLQMQRKRDIKSNYKAKLPVEKLIEERNKKRTALQELLEKRTNILKQLTDLHARIGIKQSVKNQIDYQFHKRYETLHQKQAATDEAQQKNSEIDAQSKQDAGEKDKGDDEQEPTHLRDQTEEYRLTGHNVSKNQAGKSHWEFLLKEMKWMADDFEKETKKKSTDAKKLVKAAKKHLNEKQATQERLAREHKLELKRKSKYMSNIVQLYWKSCDKIVRHNYNVQYEKKRQQLKTRKLENFVQKHLKLSVKVAETLNTNSFMQQSLAQKETAEKEKDKDESSQTIELIKNFQPTGHTLDKAAVSTKIPFLLRGSLREYQIIGLDWLVTLHNRKLNGILADEMGLGKTIQTISMLASLACDYGIWGPHLIVVPTTIIMNWEMEIKRWCPGFKILTYFGSQKERKVKRHGWSKDNSFHICITSYKLVIQDHFAFRRKKWYYMILDEAQNIKNFKSQRWQTLLRFNTNRRLLLTGTPLQNDVMELWSLMHFLMPEIFANQQDFKEWFQNPFSQSVNQNKSLNLRVVQKLQSILRPFILRRMKRDVEKQLPEKIEHIVQCNLSRRQRLLYDEYINQDRTKTVLAESDFFSIMGVLMQLRKVCNHPDLFEARTIESPFIMQQDEYAIKYSFPHFMLKHFEQTQLTQEQSLTNLQLIITRNEHLSSKVCDRQLELLPTRSFMQVIYENYQASVKQDGFGPGAPGYFYNPLQLATQQCRPFQDGLAVGKSNTSNFNGLHEGNCYGLQRTLAEFQMENWNVQSHHIPHYLNTACIPFNQQYFSLPSFGDSRGAPVSNKSALQEHEKQTEMAFVGQKLALFHSMQLRNEVRAVLGRPIYGADLRELIEIPLVCKDSIFDGRKFRYYNRHKMGCMNEEQLMNKLYHVSSAVFNPWAQSRLVGQLEPRVIISDWPEQSEKEILLLSRSNRFIKEISSRQQKLMRRLKQIQEQRQKLLQLKKVTRKKHVTTEWQEEEFLVEIETKANAEIKEQQAEPMTTDDKKNEENTHKDQERQISDVAEKNPEEAQKQEDDGHDTKKQVEEEQVVKDADEQACLELEHTLVFSGSRLVDKQNTVTKSYDEFVTYEQYLNELRDQGVESIEIQNYIELIADEKRVIAELQELQNQRFEDLDEDMSKEQPEGKKDEDKPSDSQRVYTIVPKNTDTLKELITTPLQRAFAMDEIIKNFKVIVPKCWAKPVQLLPSRISGSHERARAYENILHQKLMQHKTVSQSLKHSNIIFFPHRNLIQYDCGKLQRLAQLLKTLYNKGSKVIIFTQMTRMLNIFEQFLNIHGYIYVRLDGSVKTENRQKLVDRFNYNKKIFCFISSTRCGGVGINLTGADSVVFYDTDWNPAMDKQAQDRCHRIGQTKTVHIYRLISVDTIEENIFKKSLQKRELGGLIIEGNFNNEFFSKVSLIDVFNKDGKENSGGQAQLAELIAPKRVDIIAMENIVFENGDGQVMEQPKAVEAEPGLSQDVDFEINSQDEEAQQRELEQQRQLEVYRRRFEEALIKIEDQEDVVAYQNATREQNDNDEEDDLNEFDNVDEGMTMEQSHQGQPELPADGTKRHKGAAAANAANQKLSDQRKYQTIEWQTDANLNAITKRCLEYVEQRISFDEYLDERAARDPKFVHLNTEIEQLEEDETKSQNADSPSQHNNEFELGDENLELLAANWDRVQAEQEYSSKCKRLSTSLSTFVNFYGHKVNVPLNDDDIAESGVGDAQDDDDADMDQPAEQDQGQIEEDAVAA